MAEKVSTKEKATSTKKQVPLRLSEKLYNQIAAWAEDDFRSINAKVHHRTALLHGKVARGGAP